jgi:methyl-accepting chemotaxis protein
MQKVSCQACGQKYRIHEENLKGKKDFQCSKCLGMVQIDTSQDGSKSDPFFRQKQFRELSSYSDNVDSLENADSKTKNAVSWTNSIRLKIGSVLVAVTIFILLSYILYNYISSNIKYTDELNQLAEIVSIRLSKTLGAPLWEVDVEQVIDILNSEMLDKQVFAIIIREDNLKTIFQGSTRDRQWESTLSIRDITGEYIVREKNITWNDETIGLVEVYVTDKFMNEKSINAAAAMSVTGLILILSILGAVYLTLNKYLTRPIIKLTNATDKISLGEKDVVLDTKSNDEIGVLGQAIERMQTSLNLALMRLSRK